MHPSRKKGSRPFEPQVSVKTYAKPLRIYFIAYANSMSCIWILLLQNEFLLGDWARRFSIAWNARRTALIFETRMDKTFKKRMRFVRFALEFRVILATHEIGMIAELDQLGQRSVR